jgi:hypothetical protein
VSAGAAVSSAPGDVDDGAAAGHDDEATSSDEVGET